MQLKGRLLFILVQYHSLLCGYTPLETVLSCSQLLHSKSIDEALKTLPATIKFQGEFYTIERPLLQTYPYLKEKLAWIDLAQLPTPIKKMNGLGEVLKHSQLYLKDDGKTNEKVGGNKVRKLEIVLADALYQGAQDVVTFGCIGSNLVTETCACAEKFGLGCFVHLKPEPNSTMVKNNLLLDYLYNAHMYFYPNEELRSIGAVHEIVQYGLNHKTLPYIIPTGASSALGAIGYVNAAFELKNQIEEGLLPKPDYIYIPVGSLGSVVGLAIGLKVANIDTHIIAVGADYEDYQSTFLKLAQECNDLLHKLDTTFPLLDVADFSISFDCNFVGRGYAYFTSEGLKAIESFKELENIQLDGVYSGKCAAAFIEHIKTNLPLKNKVILFWNTFGIHEQVNNPKLYKNLPKSLHQFFEDKI